MEELIPEMTTMNEKLTFAPELEVGIDYHLLLLQSKDRTGPAK